MGNGLRALAKRPAHEAAVAERPDAADSPVTIMAAQ